MKVESGVNEREKNDKKVYQRARVGSGVAGRRGAAAALVL